MSNRLAAFTDYEVAILLDCLTRYADEAKGADWTIADKIYVETRAEWNKRERAKFSDLDLKVSVTLDGSEITNWGSRHG